MNKTTLAPHIISLSALFVLGNGCIIFPKYFASQFNFTAYLISLAGLLLLYVCVSLLWEKVLGEMPKTVLSFGVGIFALFVGAESILSLADFISKIVLPETPKFFIFLILGLSAVYFSLKKTESLLKFSLISLVLSGAVILFFFIGGADKYELRNIFVFKLPEFSEILPQIKPYLLNPVLQSLVLPVFLWQSFGETRTRQGFFGVLWGAVILGLCILSSVLLFGAQLSGSLEFPFASLVSTVTVGRLFTRLDGFAYFVFFVASVVKTAVCLKTAFGSLKAIDKSLKGK